MISGRPNRAAICRACLLLLAALVGSRPGLAAEPLEFTRMFAHWDGYGGDDYLKFVAEAHPQLVQLGFYGAHFWSLADTPDYGGYPAHLPVRGHKAGAAWFAERNKALHALGIKVVGHFNMTLVSGEPDEPSGFFRFYRDQWDTAVLGPRPTASALDLLEKDATGHPLLTSRDGRGQYWACLRNPAWQSVLKAWIARAIDLGVDGLVANYFYRHDCTCEHCQEAFRQYLGKTYTPEALRKLGIDQLAGHHFAEIVSWHDPQQTTPLRLAMLRFSQVSNKQIFDELFLKYARRLKPDFIAAQWDHLGEFQQISGDERCLLPAELWSRGESYLWYSTGGSACFTDLKRGVLGEATLQARYVRGASGDKPFTIGKYEGTRIRVAIAELAANGGSPMGFYARFGDASARRELVRYYRFLERYDELYHANRSLAELRLVYPRSRVQAGDLAPVRQFLEVGGKMLDRHVLFDVLPDDFVPAPAPLPAAPQVAKRPPKRLTAGMGPLSGFEAPRTVRVSASRPAKLRELTVHFVNYNRTEPPLGADGRPGQGSGIDDEKPLAVAGIHAAVRVPADLADDGKKVTAVEVITPEEPEPVGLPFEERAGRVTFVVPRFLVYAVVRIKF